ncbi:DinB family protein [Paenibacillus ehimensis]|uniref:DinB family protein n=1 Tax=Paenibacillus ehimensis TaxID=79264 RepID=A0ABT8VD34_9BACL|nr:DinB family protein [Paenibacillus ehimensis]MDO3678892.1 DinB family protein [Paenibacillus ehimensis]MEC0211061.1 DinB family protein [Paenibacillus ehimensis]
MTQSIIHTSQVLRQVVIGQVQGISEAQFDVQPAGFNNTIRWNVGHMIYWLDKYSTLSFGSPSAIPEHYELMFGSGTKPSDWTATPPSKDELLQWLTTQLSRLAELTPEMLDNALETPFVLGPFQFDTSGELFNFALIHEAIHLGTISSQLKAIQ